MPQRSWSGDSLAEAQLHHQHHEPFGLVVVTHASQGRPAAIGDALGANAALLGVLPPLGLADRRELVTAISASPAERRFVS